MARRIAIIGAGPAGATAALALSQMSNIGKYEIVLVDRDTFPRVKTCGSALSPRCIQLTKKLGIDGPLKKLAYGIRGLHFTGPAQRKSTISGNEGAWVIPRSEFDASIARAAVARGTRFVESFKALRLLRDPAGRVRGVSDGKQDIEADLTLIADGAHSRFSPDPTPKRQIATIMAWYEGIPFTPGLMEMWFDRRLSPWYGWLFPESQTRVNIGICYSPEDTANPRDIFNEVVDRHVGERMKGAEMVRRFRGAPIVYTEAVGPASEPGALWIGESARLTNAATGEGIGYAMQSALIAADVISRHPEGFSESAGGRLGQEYEKALRWAFTPRLKLALGFMRFAGTPMFTTLTSLLATSPVANTLAWALEYV